MNNNYKYPKPVIFYPVGFTYICFYKPRNYAKQKNTSR